MNVISGFLRMSPEPVRFSLNGASPYVRWALPGASLCREILGTPECQAVAHRCWGIPTTSWLPASSRNRLVLPEADDLGWLSDTELPLPNKPIASSGSNSPLATESRIIRRVSSVVGVDWTFAVAGRSCWLGFAFSRSITPSSVPGTKTCNELRIAGTLRWRPVWECEVRTCVVADRNR